MAAVAKQPVKVCEQVPEFSVRTCNRPRARRTCTRIRGKIDNDTVPCAWLEHCMRCVPPVDTLNASACKVDGVIFYNPPACPKPVNENRCLTCDDILVQEHCLGLCSEVCKWAEVKMMRGRFCSLRVLPPPVEDYTILIVLGSCGGFIVLVGMGFAIKTCLKIRRKAREAAEVRLMTQRISAQKRATTRGADDENAARKTSRRTSSAGERRSSTTSESSDSQMRRQSTSLGVGMRRQSTSKDGTDLGRRQSISNEGVQGARRRSSTTKDSEDSRRTSVSRSSVASMSSALGR